MTAAAPFPDVARLLAPRSVAVIGASDRPGNLGADTVRRLLQFRFPGPVWPINRSLEPVAGLQAFASLADLPSPPDLAIFAIPADALADAIRDCAAAGTKFGVAYAGGLAESGAPEGIAKQQEITTLCREVGFTLCGPNCVGYINTAVPVTATFATALHEVAELPAGAISIVSQSGGIATTAMSIALQAGFGLRMLISGGNEAVVSFADYIRALAQDPGTRVIAAYLEGVTDATAFLAGIEETRRQNKPVVMIKSGATQASARAAKAHTGSLVGEDKVFEAVLRETGVMRVWSVEEMVDVSLMVAGLPPEKLPHGPGVGIITFGGGNGVLAADQAAAHGLTIPALSPDCTNRLHELLVSVATAANPMDLTPTTAFRPEALAKLPAALAAVADEPGIDALVFIVSSLGSRAKEICEIIISAHRDLPKPVCVCWSSPPSGVIAQLAAEGIATFIEPERGLRALGRLVARHQALTSVPAGGEIAPLPFDWQRFVPETGDQVVISEDRCHTLLKAAGLPVAPGALARRPEDALRIAREIGLPVVLKGISAAVTHRAAAGLLAVDLRSEADVEAGFARLTARANELSVTLDGVYVQKMAKGGSELLVSAFRDPLFGTMISCGVGGGLTELVKDVVTRTAPVTPEVAAAMIRQLRSYAHIRPSDADDRPDAAARFITDLSRLAAGAPWARFTLEVNPIKWTADSAVAVDGLLIVEKA
jgi:acyl-CoA synthetase (NDP forming)